MGGEENKCDLWAYSIFLMGLKFVLQIARKTALVMGDGELKNS